MQSKHICSLQKGSIFFKLLLLAFIVSLSAPVQAQEEHKYGDFTIDAQLRARGEYRNGQGKLRSKGDKPAWFINERARLGFGWERKIISLKFSAQHTGVWGDESQTSSKGNLSINEAWAQLKFCKGAFVKLGRQVLSYDDERLFGALDWAVTGRSHDALTIGYNGKAHQVHGIIAFNQNKEATIGGTYYDNVALYKNMQMVWYHFSGNNNPFQISALVMNQGVEDASAKDNATSKTRYMQTLGTHMTYKGGHVNAHGSAYFQTGKDKMNASVSAWMASAGVRYQVAEPLSLSVGEDYISGSDGTSDKNKTFNVLYGTHHKFYGAMDYFNNATMPVCGLSDTYLTAAINACKKVDLSATYHYMATGVKVKDLGRTLGHEVDLQINWRVVKDVTVQGGYSMMFATETMEVFKGGNHKSWQDWAWLSVNINPRIFSTKK